MTRTSVSARHRTRCLLIQALYQWQITGDDLGDILVQFVDGRDMQGADTEYFREVLRAMQINVAQIDAAIEPFMERSLAMVDPIERAVLRLACHELQDRLEVPVRVVIDEAVELSKQYGSGTGHRFVNGVIDRLARQLRAGEFRKAGDSA